MILTVGLEWSGWKKTAPLWRNTVTGTAEHPGLELLGRTGGAAGKLGGRSRRGGWAGRVSISKQGAGAVTEVGCVGWCRRRVRIWLRFDRVLWLPCNLSGTQVASNYSRGVYINAVKGRAELDQIDGGGAMAVVRRETTRLQTGASEKEASTESCTEKIRLGSPWIFSLILSSIFLLQLYVRVLLQIVNLSFSEPKWKPRKVLKAAHTGKQATLFQAHFPQSWNGFFTYFSTPVRQLSPWARGWILESDRQAWVPFLSNDYFILVWPQASLLPRICFLISKTDLIKGLIS